jgi:chaperonin GroEL (HSP60 family)
MEHSYSLSLRNGERRIEKCCRGKPISIKLGMEKATQYLVTQINEFAQPVEDIQSIQQVATISSGNDEIIGSLIADALSKVGKEGVISLEEGKGIVTELEIEGMKLEKGFISPYFITNTEKMEVSYDNPYILLTDANHFSTTRFITNLRTDKKQNVHFNYC